MRLYNGTDAMQAQPIVTLANIPKRFASPILCRQIKTSFWFMEAEYRPVILDPGAHHQRAFAATVAEGIGENLGKHFLKELWINVQHPVNLHVPRNLVTLVRKIGTEIRGHILPQCSSQLGNQVRCDVSTCSRKLLQVRLHPADDPTQQRARHFPFLFLH